MSIQTHRLLAFLAIPAAFFGAAVFLRQRFPGSWLWLLAALAGGVLADLIFIYVVPAKCPNCGEWVKCRKQSRTRTAGEAAAGFSGTLWFLGYRCPHCEWESNPPQHRT
jgi:membrane-bound metal-dependent hydrolase YbcI (DUF457 family)